MDYNKVREIIAQSDSVAEMIGRIRREVLGIATNLSTANHRALVIATEFDDAERKFPGLAKVVKLDTETSEE